MPEKIDIKGLIFCKIFGLRIRLNIFFSNPVAKLVSKIKGVQIGRNVTFNGIPFIFKAANSSIILGSNCKFNSSRRSVQQGLSRKCAFVTLIKGAKLQIGDNSGATGVTFVASNCIDIGENVIIGAYSTIIDNDFHNPNPTKRTQGCIPSRPITIKDNVFIGMNCTILKGVTIGENSVIGANSVVVSSIPSNSFAMGNPCKLILKRNWGDIDIHQ